MCIHQPKREPSYLSGVTLRRQQAIMIDHEENECSCIKHTTSENPSKNRATAEANKASISQHCSVFIVYIQPGVQASLCHLCWRNKHPQTQYFTSSQLVVWLLPTHLCLISSNVLQFAWCNAGYHHWCGNAKTVLSSVWPAWIHVDSLKNRIIESSMNHHWIISQN